MIHSIIILKKSGEPIYGKAFGTVATWNDTLASGLISAIYHFTRELLHSNIEEFEIESYKILFENDNDVDILLVAFFDKYDSMINVRTKLKDLKDILLSEYKDKIQNDFCCEEDFEGLQEIMDVIVSSSSTTNPIELLKPQYAKILQDFRNGGEIVDCDLISINAGRPLTHEWKKEFLDLCLRQIDAFYKSTKTLSLEQITLTYKGRHLILYKVTDDLILSTLIKRETPLGLATLLVEEFSRKIAKIGSR